MSKHLRNDLAALEKRLLYLAAQVEEAVRKSVQALTDRRQDLAREVIKGDLDIDRREVELEEECLKVLALHQPVATDLRFVTACLKIDNDLERIGDLACNIAKRALSLSKAEKTPIPAKLREMTDISMQMLRDALDSFVRGAPTTARKVCIKDDRVDKGNREVISGLLDTMANRPHLMEQGIMLISISKNLERIADHATNIAEDVIYMVQGEIIRHKDIDEFGPDDDQTPNVNATRTA